MTGIRRLLAALVAALCLAALTAPTAFAVYPSSMASTGDSITTAYNSCEAGRNCPANSWSTGSNAAVNSFYLRILERNAAIRGRLFNDAVANKKMADLAAQVTNVVSQRVEYVTVAIGNNDICTETEAEMTSVESFTESFEAALETLSSRLPSALVSVLSLPNIHYLWRLLSSNRSATAWWTSHRICQWMLANPESTARADAARRSRVLQHEVVLNEALASVCARFANCRYDEGVAFRYAFETGEVSTNDYFHPSAAGQTSLASIEWGATWVF
ncbi:MAG TPA: SGNH/GDSL hydrolase family protein [Conexibacter sp.]|nr:SGNH/GDSL hydrolase family protein [Conexibacter sp.]